MQENPGHLEGYVYQVTAVATLGGLLFGFDTAVVSGAMVFMETEFAMSARTVGWATSCAMIGCILSLRSRVRSATGSAESEV